MYKPSEMIILFLFSSLLTTLMAIEWQYPYKSSHSASWKPLAYVIEGEAGVCSFEAKIAVAHVFSRTRNKAWSTWGTRRKLSRDSVQAAINWRMFGDPTNGAIYMFSASDLRRDDVQQIIANATLTWHQSCRGGLSLWAYKPK